VIDVQDRLIGTIAEHEAVVENIKALIKTAQVLKVPVMATEQEKLGILYRSFGTCYLTRRGKL
jgi:nicotinamidase-related amidase